MAHVSTVSGTLDSVIAYNRAVNLANSLVRDLKTSLEFKGYGYAVGIVKELQEVCESLQTLEQQRLDRARQKQLDLDLAEVRRESQVCFVV